jgi:hypothetical protein
MQCKEIEAVLESEGLEGLSPEAHSHLSECPACQGFVADLNTIVGMAATLPAEVEPPQRVWVALRAQMEAEGIIQQPVIVGLAAGESSWWTGVSSLFRLRVLAPTAAALALVFLGYFELHKGFGFAKVDTPAPQVATVTPKIVPPVAGASTTPASPAPVQQAKAAPSAASGTNLRPASDQPLKPSPSELAASTPMSDLASLEGDVSNRRVADNVAVETAIRQNLATLNEFIKECQLRLKQNPQDELARQYLNEAYQQKAELLYAMIDSGRSEH